MFLLTQHVVMDWNEHNIVYLLFSSLSSPSASVSPSDPTLTVENVMEVMGEVGDWERVAQGGASGASGLSITFGLRIPDSKLQEIKQLSTSDREKSQSLGRYWVTNAPGASWERLGHALYYKGEETAAAMVKQYLPKGMCIS